MTGDEFSSRFRLVEKLTETGVTTYRGTDSRRGGVLVHLMPGPETPTPETLAERGMTLAAIDELAWHECLDVEGMRVVVTTELDDFTTYEAWIEEVEDRARTFGGGGRAAEPPPAPGDVEPEPDAEPTGEVERAIEASQTPPPAPAVEDVGPPPEEVAEEEAEESDDSTVDAPGEFTRLFGAPEVERAGPAPDEDLPPVPEPAPPPEPAERAGGRNEPPGGPAERASEEPAAPDDPPVADPSGPGEYTRIMMQLEGIEAPTPPPSAPSSEREAEDAAPSPPPAREEDAPPPPTAETTDASPEPPETAEPPPPPDEPEEEEGPGPYTRLMRRSEGGGEDEPASLGDGSYRYRPGPADPPARDEPAGRDAFSSEGGGSDGYLDRLRGGGGDARPASDAASSSDSSSSGPGIGPAPRAGASPPPPPGSPPPSSSGPSEYTRIIRGDRGRRPASRPEPPSAVPAPPAPKRSPEAPGSTRKPIVIALVVAVVLLAAILVYFAVWGASAG